MLSPSLLSGIRTWRGDLTADPGAEGDADPGGAGYLSQDVRHRRSGLRPTVRIGIAAARAARKQDTDLVIGRVRTDQGNDRALIASLAFDML
ncbi:hypothetical protein U879_20820 [Defluviimonas sp. 20V17]|uniref:Uncharacterized protein n=1 Tax=Allgaiera indica TaxID=765699 RepID=A0AAN4URR5_9RHOB|nr:hypothetical protein U879_20820 [Defluviimonas sp. 20V17]GHE02545.1 hypothetical protein GCM10008024_22440 [Allgaiera indica]